MKKYQMTQAGLQKAQGELQELIDRRQDIVEKIKYAKEQGDLKENAEYQEAKNDMAFNESKILELEDLVRNAEVVEHAPSEYIGLGSKIKVEGKLGVREFMIVGATEANPTEGKISDQSPLGSAFVNRKAGEEVEVDTPAGTQTYTILEILE